MCYNKCIFRFQITRREISHRFNDKSESVYRRKIQVRRIQLMTLENVSSNVFK
jgi:hypothetical protein